MFRVQGASLKSVTTTHRICRAWLCDFTIGDPTLPAKIMEIHSITLMNVIMSMTVFRKTNLAESFWWCRLIPLKVILSRT